MTDTAQEQFDSNVHSITVALLTICERKEIAPAEAASLIGAGLVQALAHYLGPLGAVECIRDLADLAEKQCFDEVMRH